MASKKRNDIVADFRPVSVKDTAAKTGKAVNPVGSIVRRPEIDDEYKAPKTSNNPAPSNPTPTRALSQGGEAGGTGGFGAVLPRPTQPNIIDRTVNWLGQNLPGLSTAPEDTGGMRRSKGLPSLTPVSNAFGQAGAGTNNLTAAVPSVLNSFMPSSFIPIPLQGFYPQNQPTVTNNPRFNAPVVPSLQLVQNPNTPQPSSNIRRPQTQQQPMTTGGSLSPDKQGVTPSVVQQDLIKAITPPATEITPDNINQWRDYWNWQAQNPTLVKAAVRAKAIAEGQPDPFAPVVMTRAQIWKMKAEARRKSSGEETSSGGGTGYIPPVQVGVPQPYSGFTGSGYSVNFNTGSG